MENELYLGQCDLVMTGGADLLTDIGSFVSFSKTGALSKTGDCRPFSKDADGTVIGEGIVLVALRRLEDAERDGDKIYAVIRGHGTSSDGRGSAIYAPRAEGQIRAMRRAYESAGYSPETVGLVEAHGTGTPLGDATEVASMSEVFAGPERTRRCALGSVKSQIGHAKTSAGAVALFKMAHALRHKILPPTIKVTEPNDQLLKEDCPLYLNTQARPWVSGADQPRRASLSAFGFGGTNAHLTLEEYVGPNEADRRLKFPVQLFMASGEDRAAVLAQASALATKASAGYAFDGLARQSQSTFDAGAPARLSLVARDATALSALIEKVGGLLDKTGGLPAEFDGASYAEGAPLGGDVAFLFPGQGSQYVGMASGVAMHFDSARAPWDEDARRADVDGGPAMHDVVFPEPALTDEARAAQETALRATEMTQPALALASLSYLSVLNELGVRAKSHVGHSFGEIMALHAAGAFSADTAVALAHKRGALMRAAGGDAKGAMLAVSLGRDAVLGKIKEAGADIAIANENAPDQIVISGREDEIAKVERVLAPGASRRLPVASAFHSPMVAGAAPEFRAYLADVWTTPPQRTVIANVNAAAYG
ncbi:MAG: acyltransferase domain-containing protein, partial [Pseudomonadota bacterium]